MVLCQCRWLLLPEQERHAAYAATEQLIMKHQTSLRNRFEDIALHVQYLPATCFTGQPDIPCSDVPQIRHRMHSLIEIPRIPHQQVLARATARLAPKPAPTQSQGGEVSRTSSHMQIALGHVTENASAS